VVESDGVVPESLRRVGCGRALIRMVAIVAASAAVESSTVGTGGGLFAAVVGSSV
jgi:hypothetical protein